MGSQLRLRRIAGHSNNNRMILLNVLYAIGGICVIVFLHELGHFLAAKKVGARVERFFLGFDPWGLRLFSFRWGETEYGVGLLPLGGYVKLADEAGTEQGRAPSPDGFLAKPPGARALILVAGSFMNVFSGFLFFILAFTLGVSFTVPEVGSVLPGSPAWKAGLREGDRIVALGNQQVTDFFELRLGIALAQRARPLSIRVSRPGQGDQRELLDFEVVPRWNPEGYNEIGVQPPIAPFIPSLKPGSAFDRAGFRVGDRILGARLGGIALQDLSIPALLQAVQSYHYKYPAEPLEFLVQRDGETLWKELRPERPAEGSRRPQIGVKPGLGNVVRAVRPGSAAEAVFQPGDRLIEANGFLVGTVEPMAPLGPWKRADGMLDLVVARYSPGSDVPERRTVRVEARTFLRWTLLGEIDWKEHTLRVWKPHSDSPLATAGLRHWDVITHVDGKLCFDEDELAEVVGASATEMCTLRVLRGDRSVELQVPRDELRRSADGRWFTMPALGTVMVGGPAANAGISEGSILLEMDSKELLSWDDLLETVRRTSPGKALSVSWQDPSGEIRRGTVVPAVALAASSLEFPLRQVEFTVKAGPIESVALGARRTILTSKQVFLTLRSLLRRDVAAKNISGPIGIVHGFTLVLEHGPFSQLVYWLALISVNLGLLNLLPIPILDGGLLLFVAIEKLKGSAVDERVQALARNVALALLLALFVFATFHDIRRLLP